MIDWLVQNFIQNIPVYVWAFVAGAGLALYVVSGLAGRFSAIKAYAVLVRGAALILLVGGAFMAGGAGVTAAWQERIKLKQQEIEVAEQKSKDAVKQQRVVYKTKVQVIHDRTVVVRGDIARDAAKMDAECRLDPVVIKDLNEATR
jgi:type II secretory pathway component PulC